MNLRGTGCSGGAFDYFEPLQSLDGYDVIETVAAQPWVAHGAVGMVGISYPGLTQLFVAATRPPHLAAITPLSVLDDTYQTLYPGGILNDGFAVRWAEDRQADARPAASRWAQERIADGDATCKSNQALRLQSPDVAAKIAEARTRPRAGRRCARARDVRRPRSTFPVFIAGSWQDEETGGHFPEMLDDFAPGVLVKATLMNGVHSDSLGPEMITRWAEFLDFYVARRVPSISPVARALVGGVPRGRVRRRRDPARRPLRSRPPTTPPRSRRTRPSPRSGCCSTAAPAARPARRSPAFETSRRRVAASARPRRTWYFEPEGALGADAPAAASTDRFNYDPAAIPRTDAERPGADDGEGFASAPKYDWKPLPRGKAVAYVSEPLAADTVMLGTGSVDLWLQSTAPDVDLEVTISEVRPDGKETYVQSGWLRASYRALDAAKSTELNPVHDLYEG